MAYNRDECEENLKYWKRRAAEIRESLDQRATQIIQESLEHCEKQIERWKTALELAE
jgi:F0F1-type ATP synthase membrane subunit b/b'